MTKKAPHTNAKPSAKSMQKKLAKNRASSLLSRFVFLPTNSQNPKSNPKNPESSATFSSKSSAQNSPKSSSKSMRDFLLSLDSRLFLARRLKAFITDIFMLYTPILYIATYAVLGSAEAFRNSQLTIFICFILYACICAVFVALSGQTPGLKYANLKLVFVPKSPKSLPKYLPAPKITTNATDSANIAQSKATQKVGFFRAFVRVILWALGVAFVFGIFSPLFLRKFFYDSLTRTQIIDFSNPKSS